jgi:2-keto-4-pentenoate hydratase/2-oxohepta-3-ene-1,7-dioic acid hydratase in catechol pathway
MRYVTFSLPDDPSERLGAVRGDRVIEVKRVISDDGPTPGPGTLVALIESGPDVWRRIAAALNRVPAEASGHALAAIRCHAPMPRPRKNIFCLGLNYVSHAKESSRARERPFKIPDAPIFFTKATTSVTGPYDVVPWDRSVTGQVDYEAELGAIIGVGGKNIPRAEALDHVFGYTIINDVSARDVQLKHMQWFKGKSLDGFCPMGPWVVTADEFGDPHQKRISLRVSGVEKQHASTAEMIFPIDAIIESLSQGMTLEPGDVIATGTPEGVGLARTPPEYLKDGDIVETEIEGIGMLRNRIVGM